MLKNICGLYSLNSLAIVLSTLNPSLNVFSLDTEPAGLSLYSTGISSNKKFLSNNYISSKNKNNMSLQNHN